MSRFTLGQPVVLPGGVFATVIYESLHGTVYVRKEDGGQGAAWFDQAQTRAEAVRAALRLLGRVANDVEAYKLLDLLGELAPWAEAAAGRCDQVDAELAIA